MVEGRGVVSPVVGVDTTHDPDGDPGTVGLGAVGDRIGIIGHPGHCCTSSARTGQVSAAAG
jgi:hypothetical protein